MEKLKIIDFDPGCGGFTKGFEDTNLFEVVYNGSLNENNILCYNKTHFNDFNYLDIMPKEADLAVFTPILGDKLSGVGKKNFFQKQLDNFTALVSLYDFSNLIFLTKREAIPALHFSNKVMKTSDNYPTKDIICCRLLDLGYNVFNFVLNGSGFGLPQNKFFNIYWASKVIDESIFIKDGFGFFKRPYRVVKHFLHDIDDDSDLSWHNPDYKKRYECSFIKPGSNALKTKEIPQKTGYFRLDMNKLSGQLLYDFYNVSSKGPSIHPLYDRPLTIREGARLCGLTDDFTWDSKLSKKQVASMIYNSFPPFISSLIAKKVAKLIKKNIE